MKNIAEKNNNKIEGNLISQSLIDSVKNDISEAKNYSLFDIFKNGTDLWRIAVKESFIGAMVFLCYIGVHLNVQSLPGDVYVNHAIYGLVEIPADILSLIFMEMKALGRRKSIFLSLIIW